MGESEKIVVQESGFKEALDKIDNVYNNFVTQYGNFKSTSAILLGEWKGAADDKAKLKIEELEKDFATFIQDLYVLRNDISYSLSNFQDQDSYTSKDILKTNSSVD